MNMKHTVIAVFDTPEHAQEAEDALKAKGLQATGSHADASGPPPAGTDDIPPAARLESGPLQGLMHRLSVMFGVEEPHLAHYGEAVRRGGTVVQVEAADEDQATEARDTLLAMGAVNLEDRIEEWRAAGWRSADGTSAATAATAVSGSTFVHRQEASIGGVHVYSEAAAGPAFDDLRDEFRLGHPALFGTTGGTYDEVEPAYRHGHALAQDPRYEGQAWDDIEPDARAAWEQRSPESPWERVKAAVRHAWQRSSRR
jgi:hypothetical protein